MTKNRFRKKIFVEIQSTPIISFFLVSFLESKKNNEGFNLVYFILSPF